MRETSQFSGMRDPRWKKTNEQPKKTSHKLRFASCERFESFLSRCLGVFGLVHSKMQFLRNIIRLKSTQTTAAGLLWSFFVEFGSVLVDLKDHSPSESRFKRRCLIPILLFSGRLLYLWSIIAVKVDFCCVIFGRSKFYYCDNNKLVAFLDANKKPKHIGLCAPVWHFCWRGCGGTLWIWVGWLLIIIGEGCSRAWNACGGWFPLHPVLWFWLPWWC